MMNAEKEKQIFCAMAEHNIQMRRIEFHLVKAFILLLVSLPLLLLLLSLSK